MNHHAKALLSLLIVSQCLVGENGACASENLAGTHFGLWGFDLDGQDHTQRPGDDFYRFANGVYVDALVIPGDRGSISYADQLSELTDARLTSIVEGASQSRKAQGPALENKIADFYSAFMNEPQIEKQGASVLDTALSTLLHAQTKNDLAFQMGKSAGSLQYSLFDVAILPDEINPGDYGVYLMQGGLGSLSREFYLENKNVEQRRLYLEHINRALSLVHWPDAQLAAPQILQFESKLAASELSLTDLRNPKITYNKLKLSELEALAPGFPWQSLMDGAEIGSETQVVIDGKEAFTKMASLFEETPLSLLKAWAAFHLIEKSSPYLSKTFVGAQFEFYDKGLDGVEVPMSRKARGLKIVNDLLGDAVGELYAEKFFPPSSKAMVAEMASHIQASFENRIKNLDWMAQDTKQSALRKLHNLKVQVGYPAKWRDYSDLVVDQNDLFGNVENILRFNWDFRRKHLGTPVDLDEWIMTPQTVNAYYRPVFNEVVFPAAMLQPPFFDPAADAAVNYGAIGSLIGHEITHGFDDQGRQYDFDGALRDWWGASDADEFERRSQMLVAMFGDMPALPGANIDGRLTLGENIADLGGVLTALDAYHAANKTDASVMRDGLSGDQRFFLGYSQMWRGKVRPEILRQNLVADPHSPLFARINGILPNVDEWYSAFGVLSSDKLYREPRSRIRIW